MGLWTWLFGSKKKTVRKKKEPVVPGRADRTTGTATVPTPVAGREVKRVFQTDQQQNQARDILKDWLKGD